MNKDSKYVVDIMTLNPVVVGPETLASSANRLAEKRSVHALLVLDGYRLAGVVCRCDLLRTSSTGRVRDCMQDEPITIDDQETTKTAEHLMAARDVGCLPVVDWSGTLRGLVTREDLVRAGATRADNQETVVRGDGAYETPMVANDTGYLDVGGI